eukprot:SAG11_NODE_32567_length_282_cov_1.371585_1_plen_43_part_01
MCLAIDPKISNKYQFALFFIQIQFLLNLGTFHGNWEISTISEI